MNPPQVQRVRYTILSRIAIWIASTYAIVQGIGICWGGIDRWGGMGYAVVRQLPGSPYSWGVPLALLGAIALTGSIRRNFWMKFAGLLGVVVWSFCFSAGSIAATVSDPRVGTTGGPVYCAFALLVFVLCFYDEGHRT